MKHKNILPYWGLQIAPEKKIQKGNSINYLRFKMSQQKIQL